MGMIADASFSSSTDDKSTGMGGSSGAERTDKMEQKNLQEARRWMEDQQNAVSAQSGEAIQNYHAETKAGSLQNGWSERK